MNQSDRKLQIYKIRINSLLDEHADALAQAQELHEKLKNAEIKIHELENSLRKLYVQEKDSEVTIIDSSVVSSEK